MIRIPIHAYDTLNKMKNYIKSFELENKRVPSEREISNELNIPLYKVKELLFISRDILSLSSPIFNGEGEASDTEFLDFIEDPTASFDNVIDRMFYDELLDLIRTAPTLTVKEKEVLILRFGLDGNKPLTLEQVGKKFKVTRERVRQIESKAIRKLRYNEDINKKIMSYSDEFTGEEEPILYFK